MRTIRIYAKEAMRNKLNEDSLKLYDTFSGESIVIDGFYGSAIIQARDEIFFNDAESIQITVFDNKRKELVDVLISS